MTAPQPKFNISVEYPQTGKAEPAKSKVISASGAHEFVLKSADLSGLDNPTVICTEDEQTGDYDIKLILQKKEEPYFNITLEYPQSGKQSTGSTPKFTGPGSHRAMLSSSADISSLANPCVECTQDDNGDFNIKFILRNRA
jgi:hypothetical protein